MTTREPCEERIPDLVDAASGELPAERQAEFDAHLATCSACRDELSQLRAMDTVLRETSDEPDPLELAGFARRTVLAAERRRDTTLRGLWQALGRAQRFASMFSAGALAAALALYVGARTEPEELVVAKAPVQAPAQAPELDEPLPAWDLAEDEDFLQFAGSDSLVSLDDAFESLSDDELDALMLLLATGTG